MSKIFYDHLIILEEIDLVIKNIAQTPDEKEELERLVDSIVHHKVLNAILDHLPVEHHHDFLEKFHTHPHDESHLEWLKQRIGKNIEDVIREEIRLLEKEILADISSF